MSASQNNGIYVGNYLLLGRRLVSKRTVNIEMIDYYAQYFKDMGLRRFEMSVLSTFLYTSDPLTGLEQLEPMTMKKDAKN